MTAGRVDTGAVGGRLDYLHRQAELLRQLPTDQGKLAEKLRDPFVYNGAVHLLQTSSEALIDIAYHPCARLHVTAPENGVQAFEILVSHGDLPQDFLRRAIPMVRFRNLVVHGYLPTDPAAVQRIIGDHREDFAVTKRLIREIVAPPGGAVRSEGPPQPSKGD